MKILQQYLGAAKEILLYAYIWQIPFSWRIIFDPTRLPLESRFNEYTDISLYLGEILLICALIMHILEHKTGLESIYERCRDFFGRLFHVKHGKLLLLLLMLLCINVFTSIDKLLSLITIFHWFGLGLFVYLLRALYVSRGTKVILNLFVILVTTSFLQLSVAISQVYLNHSVGAQLLNEPHLSIELENVAKSTAFSNVHLRAYGTFPHPNVMAGYFLFVALLSLTVLRSFHVKHRYLLVAISIVCVLLSQSKIAVSVVLVVGIIYTVQYIRKMGLFHVKHYVAFSTILVAILAFYLIASNNDIKTSLNTRLDQIYTQIEPSMFTLIGSGIGTYRIGVAGNQEKWWNLEPVHFVPLLMFVELGCLLTICLIIYAIYTKTIHIPRGTSDSLKLGYIILLLLTDHYGWDIYQGQFLLVSAFILVAVKTEAKYGYHLTDYDACGIL